MKSALSGVLFLPKNINKLCKLRMLEKADDINNSVLEMILMKGNCSVNIFAMIMMP